MASSVAALVVLAPVQLRDGRLGTRVVAREEPGQRALAEVTHDLAPSTGTTPAAGGLSGSSATPRSRASAMRRSSSARKRMGMVAAASPRSKPSRVLATAQPLLTAAHDLVRRAAWRR